MGVLAGTSVYLIGPIESSEDQWRDKAHELLSRLQIRIYNPLVKPDWMPQIDGNAQNKLRNDLVTTDNARSSHAWATNNIIRKAGLRLAASCDFVICKITGEFTVGSFEELSIAKACDKPILFMCPNSVQSGWLFSQFSSADHWPEVFFKSWNELLEYLEVIDKGQASIDPYKWIFLTWDGRHGTNDIRY